MSVNEIIAISVGFVVLIAVAISVSVNEKKVIAEWLKYAVTEAERLLGSKTGQLKLRQVFEWFTQRFPIVASIIPFKVFSAWVDTALETMDKWIETNKYIAEYVNK